MRRARHDLTRNSLACDNCRIHGYENQGPPVSIIRWIGSRRWGLWQFGGAHPGGAMVAFADGSVRFLLETIASGVFEAIATVAGGEVLAEGWDR